jgi:hypothetical protein
MAAATMLDASRKRCEFDRPSNTTVSMRYVRPLRLALSLSLPNDCLGPDAIKGEAMARML